MHVFSLRFDVKFATQKHLSHKFMFLVGIDTNFIVI